MSLQWPFLALSTRFSKKIHQFEGFPVSLAAYLELFLSHLDNFCVTTVSYLIQSEFHHLEQFPALGLFFVISCYVSLLWDPDPPLPAILTHPSPLSPCSASFIHSVCNDTGARTLCSNPNSHHGFFFLF